MRKHNIPMVLLAALTLLLGSCLSDDDEEVTYYGDTAITAFSLGTLNRTMHTTSSTGADSTYKTTVTGSSYKFYIDQVNKLIYNPDSLPKGTDIEHVLVTITTKNGGSPFIKSLSSDSLTYINSSDSLDFSQPRTVSVYNTTSANTAVHTDYTVKVNVQQQESGKFLWGSKGTVYDFANLSGIKGYAMGGRVYVLASDGNTTSIYSTSETETTVWMAATPNFNTPIPADAYLNSAVSNGYLYLYINGMLLRSTDASNWQQVSTPALARLIGGSTYELYGINLSGHLSVSYDEGKTWYEETTAANSYLLPTQDISVTTRQSLTNDDTESVTIVGNRSVSTFGDETHAVVWSKVSEKDGTPDPAAWIYADASDFEDYELPRLENMCTVNYNNGLLALGGKGIGGCTLTPYLYFYFSNNSGLYWLVDSQYQLPDGFPTESTSFAFIADSTKRLWLISGTTGQVWSGYLTQYMWEDPQRAFTE